MKGHRVRSATAAALALALGGAAAADGPAAVARLRATMGLQPGNWHSAVTVTSVEALPAPSGKGDGKPSQAFKVPVNQTEQADDCLEASPRPGDALFLPGMRINGECRYEEAAAKDGRWHLKAHCATPGGPEGELVVEGHYGATAMDSTATVTMTPPKGAHLRIRLATTSRRTGECAPVTVRVNG